MGRDYTITSPRNFTGRNPDAGVSGAVGTDDEELPMHRAVGDEVHVEVLGFRGTGTVRSIKQGVALIECEGRWYQESGQTITEVEPSICSLCDTFPCNCHHNPVTHTIMQPVSFSELASKTVAKTPIECVEGKLTTLYDPKAYASGTRTGEQFQNGEITSGGLKVKLKIDSPNLILPLSRKGQTIRIEAKQGKSLTGLYYEVGIYQEKETRTIRLTDTATITFPGDSGASSTNAPQSTGASNPVHTSDAGYDAAQRSSVQSRASSGEGGQPVFEIALDDYYKAFVKVCQRFDKDPATIAQELTAEKIAEITTSVSMASTRGQYGAYIGYRWADGTSSVSAVPVEPSTSPTNSWQEASHPKSGVKIKDMDDSAFLKFAKWAYAPSPAIPEGDVGREGRFFQANILAACEAKKMTPRTVFLSTFAATEGVGEAFDDNDLEAVIGKLFSKSPSNLTMAEWTECLRDFSKMIEDCKKEHEEGAFIPF